MMENTTSGWTRKVQPKGGFTLGKKLMVEATNHLGYEVQEYRPGEGWKNAIDEQVGYEDDQDTPIYKPLIWADRALAEQAMDMFKTMPRVYSELRVVEAVEFPVVKK